MEPIPEAKAPAAVGPAAPAGRRLPGTVAVCSWLYLVIVLAAWTAIHAGDLWWPATLLLFGPRWLLAAPLLPLGFAAMVWRRRSLALMLLVLLLILGPIMGCNMPWRRVVSIPPKGERLRVFTCNMHHQGPHREALEQLLAAAEPDIVAIQELPSREPFDYFPDKQWYVHRTHGLALASRYPIRKAVSLGGNSMTASGLATRYELDTPAGVVTLFSLHLASPRDGLYQATHHPRSGTVELQDNSDLRRQQSARVAGFADEITGPVLLVGDFNTPIKSAIFRGTWGRYSDAFTEAGWGWGYTFLGSRTMVRIDHILAGPGWYCERCWVAENVGSPHRPVLADLIRAEPRP